jgi:hypothetical protein
VFLDERLRECVTFLFVDRPDPKGTTIKCPIGTAFFIQKSLANEDEVQTGEMIDNSHDYFTTYVITAAHVIKSSLEFDAIYIRVNKKDGTYYDHPTCPDKWVRHDADDVALFSVDEFPLAKEDVSIRGLGFPNLSTDEYMQTIPVGAGYEVFFLGLFAAHPGKTRAQPIIRFGNISLMRHDKIDTYLTEVDELAGRLSEIDAYLVEARSWGGQSGSQRSFIIRR